MSKNKAHKMTKTSGGWLYRGHLIEKSTWCDGEWIISEDRPGGWFPVDVTTTRRRATEMVDHWKSF